MSMEKDFFKKIDVLVEERWAFEGYFFARGQALIQGTVKAFLKDHPAVKTLAWTQDLGSVQFLDNLTVDQGKGPQAAGAFTTSDPQLAACMQALFQKFLGLRSLLVPLYGSNVLVSVTPAGTTTAPAGLLIKRKKK